MSDYKQGSFTAEDFEKHFGLSSVSEDKAYSEGSSTGTKQVAGLGTYLTKEDFERNRNSDATWDAYASIYGQDAANSKREGNEDGLSINAYDALMDKLAQGKAKEKAQSYQKTKQSKTLSEAKAGVKAFEEIILPNQGDYITGKKENMSQDYLDAYKLNLKNETAGKEIVGGPAEKAAEEEQAVMGA